jgi:pyruvate,water dikinase
MGRVAERKTQHGAWSLCVPPPLLGTPRARLDDRPPLKDEVTAESLDDGRRIRGQAASPGVRRGRARIVAGSVLMPSLTPGEILVAENAGPVWTPLFPILGGIVLDDGAVTQHAATTAREYGIPAVMQTRNATQRIPDGAWVTIDGLAGTVEIEEESGVWPGH